MRGLSISILGLTLFAIVASGAGCERRRRAVAAQAHSTQKPETKKVLQEAEHANCSKDSKGPERKDRGKPGKEAEQAPTRASGAPAGSRMIDPATSPANKAADRLLEIFGAMTETKPLGESGGKPVARN